MVSTWSFAILISAPQVVHDEAILFTSVSQCSALKVCIGHNKARVIRIVKCLDEFLYHVSANIEVSPIPDPV